MAIQTVHIHNETIIQVKVPLPFPLRWVNSYLIRGEDGLTLIDPGLHTEEAEAVWQSVLAGQGFRFADIRDIVLTHHHPDHYGLAGWMQERSGAPVRLSSAGLGQVRRLWGAGQPMTEALLELFRRHGMDEALLVPMREHMDGFVAAVSPQPEVSLLEPGQRVRLGDRDYEAIHTPGHAAGHLVFYDAEERIMFCGDHVLPQITPNVSYLPGGIDENPLGSFLRSLEDIGRYPVAKAYPGHREPFERFAERTGEIIAHHHQRIEQMRRILSAPQSGFAVCRAMFGDKLSLHQLRFALSETIAHLIYMEQSGMVRSVDTESGVILYQAG
ncbi:MBL fold metallo-hydrolase [Paenibacillus hamazuiensis]|uniref:MBL fold metallo-hydrolase n=1 Tax=Paenibacillus hamazuiensis TaxID=2936508 RepID=UPI00200E031B|nr:MBL fold metallo-hydrolase [Paenibacillus hamazuiensis]